MNEQIFDPWETRLRQTAESFPYPPTPPIAQKVATRLKRRQSASSVTTRRLAWAVALFILLVSLSLTVPQVRAALSYVLRVGAIKIFVGEATTTAVPSLTPSSVPSAISAGHTPSLSHLATASLPTPIPSIAPVTIADIAGETSLNIAQGRADFILHAPTYPSDLGVPDKVYMQERPYPHDQVVILVWLDADPLQQPQLTLYQIGEEDFGFKEGVQFIQETSVNGQWAIWVQGPHTLRLRNGRVHPWLFVEGNVLIWADEDITYRLESGFTLEEAVRVAESLQPLISDP